MERENGYLVIDDLKKLEIDVEDIGGFCEGWYTDGEKEYLFKLEKDLMAYSELFYSILLRKIGLKSVEYDLAIKDKEKGVITTNYRTNECASYTIFDIFKECISYKDEQRYSFYLEKIVETIYEFCKKHHIQYADNLQKDILIQYVMQILLGNRDLRASNIEFYLEDKLKMAPFYDFGYYGYINPRLEAEKTKNENQNAEPKERQQYRLKYNRNTYNLSADREFAYFLQKGKSEEFVLFKEYLEKLKEINLNGILKEIQEKTEQNVPKQTKEILLYQVTSNLEDIENIILKR